MVARRGVVSKVAGIYLRVKWVSSPISPSKGDFAGDTRNPSSALHAALFGDGAAFYFNVQNLFAANWNEQQGIFQIIGKNQKNESSRMEEYKNER